MIDDVVRKVSVPEKALRVVLEAASAYHTILLCRDHGAETLSELATALDAVKELIEETFEREENPMKPGKVDLIRELFMMFVTPSPNQAARINRIVAIRQAIGQEAYDAVAICGRMALSTYKQVTEMKGE